MNIKKLTALLLTAAMVLSAVPIHASAHKSTHTAGNVQHFVSDNRLNAIEINQSLSWSFNPYTETFHLMDYFAAGKETAFFVSFSEQGMDFFRTVPHTIHMEVYLDDRLVTFLRPLDWADPMTLHFQPRNITEAESWPPGHYRFELWVDGELWGCRNTTFYQSGRLRVLAVPILANYGGQIMRTSGVWQTGGSMIAPTFPVAQADVEFMPGAELDLSAWWFDLFTDDGLFEVWAALADLQTRNNDFDVIAGFIPTAINDGRYIILGYTFGSPAVVASEDDPEMLATVIHEIAHVFGIGDEYDGGSMNIRANMPPYGFSGRAMLGRGTERGNNPNIRPGHFYSTPGDGSKIYPQQRAFPASQATWATAAGATFGGICSLHSPARTGRRRVQPPLPPHRPASPPPAQTRKTGKPMSMPKPNVITASAILN